MPRGPTAAAARPTPSQRPFSGIRHPSPPGNCTRLGWRPSEEAQKRALEAQSASAGRLQPAAVPHPPNPSRCPPRAPSSRIICCLQVCSSDQVGLGRGGWRSDDLEGEDRSPAPAPPPCTSAPVAPLSLIWSHLQPSAASAVAIGSVSESGYWGC